MGKPIKKGIYEHFMVLIFAQGRWTDKDIESIRQPLIERHNQKTDNPYTLYNKLTPRKEKPSYSDCQICGPIYDYFMEIKGKNDGILHQGHHYLIPEDDMEDLKDLAKLLLSNKIVKKIYILYLDSLGEIDRNQLKVWQLKDIKDHIHIKQLKLPEFEQEIDDKTFENCTLNENSKSW